MSQEGRHALLVDGRPYMILGAQVNNSSAWPAMLPKVWPVVRQLGANTVQVPIAWEQIEPVEGQFDFSFLDTLLEQARANGVRLIPLWFATWKNNGPNYAPEWVRLDNVRFPRVITATGETRDSLSPHAPETLAADRKAFVALMRHLRAVDAASRTVIMVQVQNETGTYGSVRDHSPMAGRVFRGPVPDALLARLGRQPGTWSQVFGPDADEFFHAWHIARFVEEVAAAGKVEYPLPMYVNAALRDPIAPGDPLSYSAGGPTDNVIDIWKAAAPSIDCLAPDIYMPESERYLAVLKHYARSDNALFVAETGNARPFARYFFPVLGRQGIGFCPFGMDDTGYSNYPLGAEVLDEATIERFAANYRLVGPWAREWARLAFENQVWGSAEPDDRASQSHDFGPWTVKAVYGKWQFGASDSAFIKERPLGPHGPEGGILVARLGPDEFLVTGRMARVEFALNDGGGRAWTYARVEEVEYAGGNWTFVRRWNGDQTDYGLNLTTLPQILRVRLATYEPQKVNTKPPPAP